MKSTISSRAFGPGSLMGLNLQTLLRMMKAALPPTIVVAMYQSNAISDITTTVGYLTAIASIISQCLLPRGKFSRIMFSIVLSTCTAASICCLAVYCAVKARDGDSRPYNSNACAVSAVWLLLSIWLSNTLRAYRPVMMQDPMVAFSIYSGVTLTHAGQFVTITQGLAFIKRLLAAFLIGFAIATGVSLLILPITSRRDAFKDAMGYAQAIQDVCKAQLAYVRVAQDLDPQILTAASNTSGPSGKDRASPTPSKSSLAAQEKDLDSAMAALVNIHDKMANDVALAGSEVAWGKLEHADLRSFFMLFRSIMLPLSGMSSLPVISQRLPWDREPSHHVPLMHSQWRAFLTMFLQDMEDTVELVMLGIQHSIIIMHVASAKEAAQLTGCTDRENSSDVEKSAQALVPGNTSFASCFDKEMQACQKRCQDRRRSDSQAQDHSVESTLRSETLAAPDQDSDEIFKFLFLEHLLQLLRQSALDLVSFAESNASGNRRQRDRLVLPAGWLWKGFMLVTAHASPPMQAKDEKASMERKRDPEHLPAANLWETLGEKIALFPHILGSEQSSFGFRVAAASLSVAILAFLRQTQDFFFAQRVIWVLIIIVIGMSPTSGATMFSFFVRIVATIIAFALSLIVWYVVDGHTAGVIVLLFIANTIGYYWYVTVPKLFGPSVVALVTLNVIVAYELQVNKIGITAAESSGQPYYPIYQFGSYKLVCVIIGCAIALVWTVFPYPLSSSSQARKVLGRSLFVLANFYSCMHTTIELWINKPSGDSLEASKSLEAAKNRLFAEEMQLIAALRTHTRFSKFDPPLGGKFPAETYTRIISELQHVLISMALMAQTTRKLHASAPDSRKEDWLRHLAQAITSTNFNSHITTSLLCHLSAAVSNGLALPPYLSPPASFGLARELRNVNAELVDVKNASDESFKAFASLEVLSAIVSGSLSRLVGEVKTLVGEVSFDGHTTSAYHAEIHVD